MEKLEPIAGGKLKAPQSGLRHANCWRIHIIALKVVAEALQERGKSLSRDERVDVLKDEFSKEEYANDRYVQEYGHRIRNDYKWFKGIFTKARDKVLSSKQKTKIRPAHKAFVTAVESYVETICHYDSLPKPSSNSTIAASAPEKASAPSVPSHPIATKPVDKGSQSISEFATPVPRATDCRAIKEEGSIPLQIVGRSSWELVPSPFVAPASPSELWLGNHDDYIAWSPAEEKPTSPQDLEHSVIDHCGKDVTPSGLSIKAPMARDDAPLFRYLNRDAWESEDVDSEEPVVTCGDISPFFRNSAERPSYPQDQYEYLATSPMGLDYSAMALAPYNPVSPYGVRSHADPPSTSEEITRSKRMRVEASR